jgi:hypothetical protein
MSEEKQEVSEEIEWEDAETTTRSDLISCAYYAISAVEDIDLTLVSKMEANRIKTIRRQSLDIIAEVIGEMHAEIFDVEKEVLFQINTLRWKTLELDCDPKLPFRDFLQDVPSDITTLDSLLVWLSTESQRRILMSKI